jgi:hypothetical protein
MIFFDVPNRIGLLNLLLAKNSPIKRANGVKKAKKAIDMGLR